MKKNREEIARRAQRIAAELREALGGGAVEGGGAQQGSAHRKLPEAVRKNFIDFRASLFELGIYDPVLVRFDSATASQADTSAIANRLVAVSESLAPTAS